MNREEAITGWFNESESIKLEQVHQLIREAFNRGVDMGVTWNKRSGEAHRFSSTQRGDVLDDWYSEPVRDNYL